MIRYSTLGPVAVRWRAWCRTCTPFGLLAALALGPTPAVAQTANSYRGLWVGQATLSYANEVSVPLNSNNVPVAPNPAVPTPTHDLATIRLILHVNGAGQVSLLKDVALLNRAGGTNLMASEQDLALVTDDRLYGQFPPQAAQRLASAVFDFGDSKATDAVNAVIDAVVSAVVTSVSTNTSNLASLSGRTAAENAAAQLARQSANPIATSADVAATFEAFLQSTNFNSAAVNAVAVAPNAAAAAAGALLAATTLQNSSFYGDPRAVEMVQAVLAALGRTGSDPAQRRAVAQNTASTFDDLANSYQRFIAGKQFGDMIASAAATAAIAATNTSATTNLISSAVTQDQRVFAAGSTALDLRSRRYDDTRGTDAIQVVVDAIVASAGAALTATNRSLAVIQTAALRAGQEALASEVSRYPLGSLSPTTDYNSFVVSTNYLDSVQVAAAAAAAAAVLEKKNNVLFNNQSLANEARLAAIRALNSVLAAAARTVRHELPMAGAFAPDAGDPRLTWDVHQTNTVVSLGPPGLTATIALPANHPTNPFRHRRHPDHSVGFDVTRNVRLDFQPASAGIPERAGYGVDRIRGVYREEIFGLHKPLGPQQDIGLRVEGTFELNRVSLIDTLNAR